MYKKTVVRRLMKYVPTTPELSIAIQADNEDFRDNSDVIDVTPISRKGDVFNDEPEPKQIERKEVDEDYVEADDAGEGEPVEEQTQVREKPAPKRIKVKVREQDDEAVNAFD
jgi:recombinational DNA repair protein RecT